MITLTAEQAQQIEKSLSGWKEYDAWTDQQMWNNDDEKALVTIREARAQEQAENNDWKKASYIRETLNAEQAEQEPVEYLCPSFVDNFATGRYETCERTDYGAFPVYSAPVPTKDLTDEEIHKLVKQVRFDGMTDRTFQFARAVIQEFRRKNGIV